MAATRTLAIIKPDAVANGMIGDIIRKIELERFQIVAMKMAHLSRREAENFYYVHKERPFFPDLVSFMTSGPAVVMVLEGDGAVERWRSLMGETDPQKAERNTMRKLFATNKEKNAVHGSDSASSAEFEINCFFKGSELHTIDAAKVMASGSVARK